MEIEKGNKEEFLDNLEKEDNKKEMEILNNPNLFELIVEKELSKQIIGEEKSRKAIFLSLCSIYLKDCRVPLNTMVSSETSGGKSYICGKIVKIFPEDKLIYRSKISGEAFTYWHVNEDDWTWDNKILYLEDIRQDVLDSPTFKVMCSEGSTATVVRNQRAVDLIVNGKPCLLITTAETNPKKEILTRFQIVGLDETDKQTRAITLSQAKDEEMEEYDPSIKRAMGLLKIKDVHISFGKQIHDYITDHYSWADLRMRRDFSRLKDLIKCSAVLHQYQRETDSNERIIANKQDYEIARECINYIQTTTLKGLIHKLKRAYDFCIIEGEFKAKEIHARHPFVSLQMWYKYLDDLCERGLLLTELRDVEGVKQKVTIYIVPKERNLILPEFEQLNQLNQLNDKGGGSQQENSQKSEIMGQESGLNVLKVLKDKYKVLTDIPEFLNLDGSKQLAHKSGEIIELDQKIADILLNDKKIVKLEE